VVLAAGAEVLRAFTMAAAGLLVRSFGGVTGPRQAELMGCRYSLKEG